MYKYFIFFIVFLCSTTMSATIRVPIDQPTIQVAIDSSAMQDTIMISPGTYIENIDFKGSYGLILIGAEGPEVTIIKPFSPTLPAMSGFRGLNACKIYGFTITGEADDCLVEIEAGASIIISNCVFRDFGKDNPDKVVVKSNGSSFLYYNVFDNNGRCFEYSSTSTDRSFNYNTVYNCNEGVRTGEIGVNSITHNIFSNISGAAINGYVSSINFNCFWQNGQDYVGDGNWGALNLFEDPKLVDPKKGDFHLAPNSPLIWSKIGAHRFEPNGPVIRMMFYSSIVAGTIVRDGYIVGTENPSIVWGYFPNDGIHQEQYELEIGTDSDWKVAEMWQPGTVTTQAKYVNYHGLPFTDETTYFIRIRVNDGTQWGDWTCNWFRTSLKTKYSVPDDFSNIQDAVNATSPGDTVLVSSGTYLVNLSVGTIKLLGEGAESTILKPYRKDYNTIKLGGLKPLTQVSGFTFSGGEAKSQLQSSTIHRPTISDNIFTKFEGLNSQAACIWLFGGAFIENNLFVNNIEGYCIRNYTDGLTYITNNTFHNNPNGIISPYIQQRGVINNNIFSHISGTAIEGLAEEWDYNCMWNNSVDYGSGVSAGENSVFADPLFCDMNLNNYSLQSISPCLSTASDGGFIGALDIGCVPTDVPDDGGNLPYTFSLGQNYPNPFNPSTTIEFSLSRPCQVTLVIYNPLGQRVKLLIDRDLPAGYHSIEWDGKSQDGSRVASGMYFYRLIADEFDSTKKMVLIK